jgi:hypothetical protein
VVGKFQVMGVFHITPFFLPKVQQSNMEKSPPMSKKKGWDEWSHNNKTKTCKIPLPRKEGGKGVGGID